MRQIETGKAGLTQEVRKLFEKIKEVKHNFWYTRNLQTKVIGYGKKAALPKNEKGKPDFAFLYNSNFVAIELKSADGKLSEYQELQKTRIENAGGRYFICRTIKELISILVVYKIL